jgi:APA family basic amino acid/polyamine antiporter
LGGIAISAALYLLLNAAFLSVLSIDQVASSKLVAADVATAIFGARGGAVIAALALLVVLASLNGNVFVTPRVLFGLAREGLGPAALARVNAGGTPWVAMLLVGVVAAALAASGTFEKLLGLSITMILVIDSWTILALFPLRKREPMAPFRVPAFPVVPIVFVGVYAVLFVGSLRAQAGVTVLAVGVIVAVYGASWLVVGREARRRVGA